MSVESERIKIEHLAIGAIVGPLVGAPIIAISTAWYAFVLYKLWGWYFPNIIDGGPRFDHAFGLTLIVHLLTYRPRTGPYSSEPLRFFGDLVLMPVIFLVTGWLAGVLWSHGWIPEF